MTDNDRHTSRRTVLGALGAGVISSVAGCLGGVPGIGNESSQSNTDFLNQQKQIDFANNLRSRRMATMSEWPIQKREGVPKQNAKSWKGTTTFESAVWEPPKGWENTPAGDVTELEIINHGAASMEFDPATLATHELFEEKTGIKLNVIEIGVDQANQREQSIFQSQESSPQLMNVNGPIVPVFVEGGYLAPVDALYPNQGVWDMYIPALQSLVEWDIDPTLKGSHEFGFPNIAEASLGHLRTDLVKNQGLKPNEYQGEWSWDLLEETMKAFKGTGTYGFAYYAGTPTYLSYSFRELLYQQGGRLVQNNGDVRFDTKPAITTVAKMSEWYQKGWVPGDVLTYGEGNLIDLFLSGQLAYVSGFSDFVPQALDKYKARSQYLPILPPKANTGPNPSQSPLVDPNATAINTFANTGDKLASLLYGDLRLSYPSQWWEFTYEGNMSYLKQVYDDAGKQGFVPFGDVYGRAIENGVVELFPQMQSVFNRMVTPVQEAIKGEMSPKQAMEDLQSWIDENINNGGGS